MVCGMQQGVVQVPVFVYPSPITFYLEDQSTHKQVLTLYNPYDFPIRFRGDMFSGTKRNVSVLCTAPNKYTVVDPEGSIRPKFCVDIVVRHSAVSPATCNITDKFRIHLQNHTTKQLIGKQDVAATLLPGKPSGLVSDHEEFQRLPHRLELSAAGSIQQQFSVVRDYRQARIQTPNYIVIVTAVMCIVALLLPTQGDQDTRFPMYLHLTSHLKMVFAYVLGLVTMVILRPS